MSKTVVKSYQPISNISAIILGILFILSGLGIIHKQDEKMSDICVGLVLVSNALIDLKSAKKRNSCVENGGE